MDFEATDRWASQHVLVTRENGYTFYVADNDAETLTDIPSRARRYKDSSHAALAAQRLEREPGLAGYRFRPFPAINLR